MKKFILTLILLFTLSFPVFAETHHICVPIDKDTILTEVKYDHDDGKLVFKSESHFAKPTLLKTFKTYATDMFMAFVVYPDNRSETFMDMYYYQKHVGKFDDIQFNSPNFYNECLQNFDMYKNC